MSERLNNLTNILQRSNPLDFLHMSAFIQPQHQKILSKIQEFGEKHLKTQQYYDHYNNATFPHYIIQEFRKLDIGKYFISKPYGQQLSLVTQGIIIASLAQYDLSFSTFLFLQLPLCGRTIFKLGSQEHKKKYLDDIIHLKKIWGWALTERNVGSNSTRVQTNFKPTQGGFILQGNKRWIGNGNNDFLIVYGNLKQQNNKNRIIGCIVENSRPGVTSKVIQNKYSLRIVQNCQIEFEKVNLPKSNMLPGANNYKEGVQNVLKHSRVLVIWNAVGACIGVYKNALQYSLKRIQFSKPIASFQLVQQKLVRIMGNLQGIILSIWRITELYQNDNNLSTAKIGMFKAWVTERARLICQLGRQILGGNGILQENYVMKALNDMEAIYTYQGSYEMNVLVAGSQLTGLKAFT